jgi:hypothetical protein
VEKVYKGDSSSLAVIEGAMGLGAFLTGVAISLLHFEIKEAIRFKMISLIVFFFGLFFLVFSFSQFTWQGALVIFAIGSLSTFLNIQVITYLQTAVEQAYVPAVMTTVNLISSASLPFTFIFLGLVIPYIHVPLFFKICSLIVIVMSFFATSFLRDKK